MNRKVFVFLCLASISAIGAAVPASAGPSPLKVTRFKADAKVTINQGEGTAGMTFDAKYWVNGDQLRTEMTETQNNVTLNTIMRDKLIYFWNSGATTGSKIPADSDQASGSLNFTDIERCLANAQKLGDETVSAAATTHYRFANCGNSRGAVDVWLTKKEGAIQKMAMESNGAVLTAIFDKIVVEPIPESMFFPPPRIPFIAQTPTNQTPPVPLPPRPAGGPTKR